MASSESHSYKVSQQYT